METRAVVRLVAETRGMLLRQKCSACSIWVSDDSVCPPDVAERVLVACSDSENPAFQLEKFALRMKWIRRHARVIVVNNRAICIKTRILVCQTPKFD